MAIPGLRAVQVLSIRRPPRRLSLEPRAHDPVEVTHTPPEALKAASSDGTRVSAATRWGSRPVRVLYRGDLLEDLKYAVGMNSGSTVLALFGFKNLKQYLDTILESDGDELLGRIAARLAGAAGKQAIIYEPRRGEFCALFSAGLSTTRPHLERAVASINKETKALGIATVLGVVELPTEARTVSLALSLADARRTEIGGVLRPTRRHSIYTLVSRALGRPHEPSKAAA